MSRLILSRHGATRNNEEGIWTGLMDADMSVTGYGQVAQGAEMVAGYTIDVALTSELARSRNTGRITLAHQSQNRIPMIVTGMLNEKDYGIFTGQNKQQVLERVGEEEFMRIRRSWDYRIPGGESLKDVYERMLPVLKDIVIPVLDSGRTAYISSHNNTLRAIVKEVEDISDDGACEIELGTAEVRVYDYQDGVFTCEQRHVIGDVY